MTRDVKFEPVTVDVLGVLVHCANNEIADGMLHALEERKLDITKHIKINKNFCYSSEEALLAFYSIYNETTDR